MGRKALPPMVFDEPLMKKQRLETDYSGGKEKKVESEETGKSRSHSSFCVVRLSGSDTDNQHTCPNMQNKFQPNVKALGRTSPLARNDFFDETSSAASRTSFLVRRFDPDRVKKLI